MRHVPEGQLRRLVDEPFAVADAVSEHVGHCPRCAMRREQIAEDAAAATARAMTNPKLTRRPLPKRCGNWADDGIVREIELLWPGCWRGAVVSR